MFSGLVEDIGTIVSLEYGVHDTDMLIKSNLSSIQSGDSLAVNGVCLTARSVLHDVVKVTASHETLKLTNLGMLTVGALVNLEPSLTLQKFIGGHIVQGHVANTTHVLARHDVGDAQNLIFSMPPDLHRYIVTKGYIAVDGMSLTIVREDQHSFEIMLIPHTLHHTIAHTYDVGTCVNIEVDIYGRYVEKFHTLSSR